MLDVTNGLVLDILNEVTQVKQAVAILQKDVSQLKSQTESQGAGSNKMLEAAQLIPELAKVVLKLKRNVEEQASDSGRQFGSLVSKLEDQRLAVKLQQEVTKQIALTTDKLEKQSLGMALQVKVLLETVEEQRDKLAISSSDQTRELGKLREVVLQTSPAKTDSIQQAITELDTKLHTYVKDLGDSVRVGAVRSFAEVTRATHTAVILEQEKEKLAREARSLNLRVVGFSEDDGEDVKASIIKLFQETLRVTDPTVEQAYRVGKGENRPRAVLVRFATTEGRGEVLANRGQLKGLRIWIDPDLTPAQQEDKRRELQKVREATEAGFVACVSFDVEFEDTMKQFLCMRMSVNRGPPSFLITAYFAPWGAPVYANAGDTDPLWNLSRFITRIRDLGPVWIFGDFNGRVGTKQGESEDSSTVCSRPSLKNTWCRESVDGVLNQLGASLEQFIQGLEWDSASLTHTIIRTARKVFIRKRSEGKRWFDDECSQARAHVLSANVDDRPAAYRQYKVFIRAKKRRFLRELQFKLASELCKDPALFWRRLRPKKREPELSEVDLHAYVTKLYVHPTANALAKVDDSCCVFREEEVERALKCMGLGRTEDSTGLKVELLRWGGGPLLSVVTRLLNLACRHGFPEDWTRKRVIPLFKAGCKSDPKSYRTIMVGSVFARLFGRILEDRISTWCDTMAVRAPAQAGFRRTYSTLDHAIVLRVLMEEAKRTRQPLFVLFIDFSKAFDLVSRSLLGERLVQLGVPNELINGVAQLYQSVKVMVLGQDVAVEGNLGVIQGCPLSPTLFGVFIDSLYWLLADRDAGVQLGNTKISSLLFADDVAIVANSEAQMKCFIQGVEEFCSLTGYTNLH
ncbi:hypothetical protein R1sor_018043 [Riccia sorocarpa]|uniref:Reverse transcriptase domain-containing protein n=1 Tax=Riccia sorocarpa TaxID=122646 RepID=A0ABD3I9N5_9MARC